MPRRFRQSQSNDHDLVPYTKYRPKSRLPSLYDQLRSTSPPFIPIKLDPITNPGPNLPADQDLDDLIAYFKLFFTDNLIQYLVDCTNHQAERERERSAGLPARSWKPISQVDMETYLGRFISNN
jgi:Transposase IS4